MTKLSEGVVRSDRARSSPVGRREAVALVSAPTLLMFQWIYWNLEVSLVMVLSWGTSHRRRGYHLLYP